MRSFNLLPVVACVVGAEVAQRQAGSPTRLPNPANSAYAPHANIAIPGGSPSEIRGDGPWHWGPGHFGHHPHGQPRPHGPGGCVQIQYDFPQGTSGPGSVSASRAAAVKNAYVDAWNEYAKFAFGNDTLLPVSMTSQNDFYDWSLTIVDGIDTAIVMGLRDIVDRQLAHIATIDFSKSPQLPDGFDTTIRYIGGLLSSYDLITSGLAPFANTYNKDHVKSLLAGAKTLADLLTPLFNTPSGLPHFFINTTTHLPSDGPFPFTDPLTNKTFTAVTNTAVAGTIILEYHRLSDLTGDEKYRQMADRAEANLVNPKPEPIYPGLVGGELDINTGEFFDFDAGWKSGIDSFYEYLIKSYIYNPKASTAEQYKDFWVTAVESTEQHLAVHPFGFQDLTFITELNASGAPLWRMDDYACFSGGNFLLGGAYLGRQDMMDLGSAVADSCHKTFNSTASGLNPLTFAWYGPNDTASDPQFNGNSSTAQAARTFFDENGFFVTSGLYTLYPEPVESMFYAHRITGDPVWQEYNWEVFQAMQRDGMRNGAAMSCLFDITQPLGGDQFNYLPSYYFAETLKYLYLTFSDPNTVSLDDFTFNTEGHPLRIQGGTCSTSSGGQHGHF